MNTLLVTSTEEGVGKTAIALALATHAQRRGQDVAYMKPKGTRLRSVTGKTRDEDPMLARELLGLDAEVHEMEPVVYSPTFIQDALRGRQDPEELRERIVSHFADLTEDADFAVIEGSGSPAVGGVVGLTDPDIAEYLDAQALVVSPYEQVTDVDTTLATAQRFGDRLAGVLYNGVRDVALEELDEDVLPFLHGRGVTVFGELPRDQLLASVSISDLADSLGAEVLTSEGLGMDNHVERFTVGAMSGDAAFDYFRRTREAVMIAGGDRADIQTVALEASGIKGLVLTGGFRPSSVVLGRAEEESVPVLLVQSDTRTTINRIEEALQSGQTRREETVERMVELLAERADIDALLSV
jgi:BioD-like phosphotransacetylase family protein